MKAKKLLNIKILTGAFLLVMFLSIMTPVLFYPKQVQAQAIVSAPILEGATIHKSIWDKVWEFLKEAWRQGAGLAYKNAINSYTSTIATQTAEWVAGGGKGQSPLFISDPDYWTKLGDDMLGEFIDAAVGPKGFFGQSLCDPIDPTLRLNILISFDPLYQKKVWKQETKCSYSKIVQRLNEAKEKNLIEFSIDFKEGPVGRYSSSFKSVFEADGTLKNWALGKNKNNEWVDNVWINGNHKQELEGIADELISIQNDFSQAVEDLKVNKINASFIIQTSLQDRIKDNVWGPEEPYIEYLKYWQKNTPACAAKKQKDFCFNQDCLLIGNISQTDCEKYVCKGLTADYGDQKCKEEDRQYSGYINALAYTQRANLYVKQLVDWTITLEGMIKKTDFTSLTTKEKATLEDIGRMYSEDNDLRVTLSLQSSLMEKQADAITKSQRWQSLQGRMNDVTTKISGLTKTPSTLVSEATRQVVEKGEASPMQYTGVAAADAIGIFTSTLTSKLLNQLFEKGFNWNYAPFVTRIEPFLSGNGGPTTLTKQGGESFFANLTVAPLKKGGEISIYDEYSVCPQDSKYALPSNCVMDSGIVRALEENLTLKQAMDKNLIHPDWLISGRSKKDAATDYLSRYSLTNIKKLRAIRIFPLGLEIAATKIYNGELGDAQFKLEDIVDGFDKVSSAGNCDSNKYDTNDACPYFWDGSKCCSQWECSGGAVSENTQDFKIASINDQLSECNGGRRVCKEQWQPASPFCHLVDPNWVLKVPSFQCETIAYSAIPLPGSSQRQETCVDMKDCIHEDANGKCDTWGYCTREKNIWRAGGNSCDSQFNTCQTYKRTGDNKSFSYLANTLNFSNCGASDVGCKWYCSDYGKGLAANNQDIWACTEPGKSLKKSGTEYISEKKLNNAIFFNRNVEKCDASANGCHEYIRTATDSKIYLKTAPEWMDCEGGSPSLECSNFATSCFKEDVGCGLYTPINNDPIIPGIVSENNRCSEKCVGVNYFKEMDTNFETGQPDVLLIPSLAKSCSAPGCEEFTNLDEVAKGGEGIQYYSYLRECQKPDVNTCSYYYTWVGSDTNGYQLKKYYLKSGNKEPAEVASPSAQFGICDKDQILTNPHCKEFYDADGYVSYHIYENTITCSDDCHSLRRTTRGQTYDAIPAESVSCSKANIDCREYKGNAANNIRQVFKSDFEDITNQSQYWINGKNTSVSATYPGHSLESNGIIYRPVADSINQDKSYLLSFWIKLNGNPDDGDSVVASFSGANGQNQILIGEQPNPLVGEWQEIKFGPVYFNRTVANDESLYIAWYGSFNGAASFNIDNIILKEVKDDLNLIKNSWKTKMTPLGCTVPGCQAYKDQSNKLQYLTSFTRLCDEKSVGCEALTDTQNSTSPDAKTFENGITVPADSPIYLINDSKKSCQTADKGCQKFGLPTLSSEGTVVGWSDLYLKNNPDNYETKPILCSSASTGCEEYNISGSGSSVYFKDPGENLCEWREKVMGGESGASQTGWFVKGTTNQPCYYNANKTPYQINGIYGIKTYGESDYENVAGVCPQKQTGCTQFTDSGATSGDNLIDNGDFETGNLGKWQPAYGTEANNNSDTSVEITKENPANPSGDDSNFKLKITGREGFSNSRWNRYGLKRDFPFTNLPAGTSFTFSAKVYVPVNLDTNISPNIEINLFYDGWKDFDSTTGCVSAISGQPVPAGSLCECDDLNSECYPVKSCLENHAAGSICAGWDADSLPGKYRDCTARYVNASDPFISSWCWYTIYNYMGFADMNSSSQATGGWKTLTETIVAGGSINPKNLPLVSVAIRPVLRSGGDEKTTPVTGTVYYDDISFKPIQNYYYLNDDRLDQSSCQGNVSQKNGCILLLDSGLKKADGQVSAIYNTFATYKKSEATNPKYGLVSPVDCSKINTDANSDYQKYCSSYGQIKNDANTILKVQQDRTCGEWLTCTSSRSEWDTNSGSYKDICEAVGRCDKLIGSGNANQCGHLIWEQNPQPLTAALYQDRDVSWSGMDYAGHSIYNMYPIERLTAKEYVDASNNNLGYKLSYIDAQGKVFGVDGKTQINFSKDNKVITDLTTLTKSTIAKTCRAYPEKDSPFKSNADGALYYSDVNICSDASNIGDQKDCQCSYTKAVYGGTTKYYNSEGSAKNMICIGSNGDEISAVKKEDCEGKSDASTGNTWTLLTKKTNAIGLRGFCLEPDPSKPADVNACITWWPGTPTGDPDIYNQFTSAGYQAANGQEWYCAKKITPSAKSNPITNAKEVTASGSCAQWGEGLAYKCYDINDGDNPTCPSCTDTWTYKETFNYYKNDIASIDFNLKSDSDWCGLGHRSGWWDGNTTIKANNPDWKASWKKGADYVDITVLFDESNKLTGFNLSSCDGSADDGGFGVAGITINFNTGCGQVVKIANEKDQNMTKAFTNRVNNIKNYYNTSDINPEIIDSNKKYIKWDAEDATNNTLCQPWGALGSWDQSAYITSASGCGDNIVDSSSIYSSITPLQKLFAQSYSIYKYIFPGVCKGKCDTDQAKTCVSSWDCPDYTCNLKCEKDGKSFNGDCSGKLNGNSCGSDDSGICMEMCGNDSTTACTQFMGMGPWECSLSPKCEAPLTCSTDSSSCSGIGNSCGVDGIDPQNYYTYLEDQSAWQLKDQNGMTPQIASVNCSETNQCQINNSNKITIGDVDNKDITRSQSYLAVLKFYAWADKDQMPIRNITIDWGDIIQPNPYLVMAKNHKPVCCADNLTCDNFGDTPNACTENYFQFNHIYHCSAGGPGWDKLGCSNSCCFQPKVSITDNWDKTTNVSFQGLIKIIP
ncbi:MAG: hypothetical protein WC499_03405 [Patescibacteria group bacterium]